MDTQTTPHNTPRDTFLYLLSIATLIASAVSFGILLFQLINIYFPDILSETYYYASWDYSRETLRTALATLVVVFPVFFWASRKIKQDIAVYPEKRSFKLRKWLIYLTIFLAGGVIIGDLITLLNNFLRGELTVRFILKVVSVLFIAGSIFYYYLDQLKDKAEGMAYKMKAFPKLISVIVLAAIVWGFIVAGSPQSQRAARFDQRRVGDLQLIQDRIIDYWTRKNILPSNLEALKDDISGFTSPRDPKTGVAYEYAAKGTLSFELCATFETTNMNGPKMKESVPWPDRMYNWSHDAGRQCFTRTIDPQIYRPIKP